MSQPTGNPIWDDASRLPGMRSVLDPGDIEGARNRAIDRSQKHALERALRPIRGATTLDLGSGVGRITTWLGTIGADAVGIDPSAGMISVARMNAPKASFARASAEAIPFRNESFDAIVSVFVLQYLVLDPDALRRALEECWRVLRPGGRLAAIEQVNEGNLACGAPLARYLEGFRAAGFGDVDAAPARLSDSRILEQVRRRPFVGRTPGIGFLIGREARSRKGRPMSPSGYADHLFLCRARSGA